MATSTRPSIPLLILHVFLTMATGGAWLIVLLIWHLMKK